MKAIGKYIAKTFGYDEPRDMDRPGTSLARVSKRDMMKEETAGMAMVKNRRKRSNSSRLKEARHVTHGAWNECSSHNQVDGWSKGVCWMMTLRLN